MTLYIHRCCIQNIVTVQVQLKQLWLKELARAHTAQCMSSIRVGNCSHNSITVVTVSESRQQNLPVDNRKVATCKRVHIERVYST